jgi:hypothetical protein
MATEDQIRTVLNCLAEVQACGRCGTRFRFGDVDCPHCGEDLEDVLRQWAEQLLDALSTERYDKAL